MNHENQHSNASSNPTGKTRLRIRFVEAVFMEIPVRQYEHRTLQMEKTEAVPFSISEDRAIQQL